MREGLLECDCHCCMRKGCPRWLEEQACPQLQFQSLHVLGCAAESSAGSGLDWVHLRTVGDSPSWSQQVDCSAVWRQGYEPPHAATAGCLRQPVAQVDRIIGGASKLDIVTAVGYHRLLLYNWCLRHFLTVLKTSCSFSVSSLSTLPPWINCTTHAHS